ncbi:hypothetical protein Tco_0829270 [Tanacetum coccineum]
MYYPRFTKVVIHHFITKDKTISMRNRLFMHTAQDDCVLSTMRFVSKSEYCQVYEALLPEVMTNQKMQNSSAYKTYLAYATGAAIPRNRENTPGVSVSKKKAPVNAARSKGIDLLSEAALLEEAQLKKDLKRSKRETSIHQAGGSNDEDVQDSDDEPQHADDERTASENQETNDDEKETEDEFVHTPPNNVPTDDETNDESNDVDEEEYDRIDKELYGDVNIKLKDSEHKGEGKDDEKMTDVDHVYVVVENVDQEGVGSSISSDYAAKFLNFDNIPPADTEVIFMMDIYVQHEVPPTTSTTAVPDSETLAGLQLRVIDLEKDVKELKDVDNSTQIISTIKFEVPNAVKEYL